MQLCLKCLAEGRFRTIDKCKPHNYVAAPKQAVPVKNPKATKPKPKLKRMNLSGFTAEQRAERSRQLARLRRMKFTPEQIAKARERHLRAYQRNRDRRMQRMREWYQQNKESQQAKNRARYAQAKERMATDAARR